MAVNPIPEGYPRVSPYLVVDGAAEAIAFYTSALGATERMRMPGPDGKIAHAEIGFGDSIVMLADTSDQSGPGPKQLGGSPVSVMLYVEDVDAVYQAAIDAGAESVFKPEDAFYGDRGAGIVDPWGHRWHLATHVEDVSEEEMQRRMQALMGG
jgi:PhnB protein